MGQRRSFPHDDFFNGGVCLVSYILRRFSVFLPGSLCSSIFDPLSALVGASGGVYALIGGYFMNAVVVSWLIYTNYCSFLSCTVSTSE